MRALGPRLGRGASAAPASSQEAGNRRTRPACTNGWVRHRRHTSVTRYSAAPRPTRWAPDRPWDIPVAEVTSMFALLLGAALLAGPQEAEVERKGPPPLLAVDADEVRTRVARAVEWLQREQRPDGAWGSGAMDSVQFTIFSVETYYAFQLGANALAFLALSSIDPSPETDAALSRSLEWLSNARVPKRGNDWDVDCSWAALYGFQAMLAAWQDPRFQDEALRERIRAQGLEFYALLEKNQEPHGGWGYYEGPVVSRRPTWATSFATACVVPSLVRAVELGWPVDAKVIARARDYLERCRLPNGAYSYDLRPVPRVAGESIDNVRG